MIRHPPRSTLFPYTTLFRSHRGFPAFLATLRSKLGDNLTVTRELHDAFGSDAHAVQLLRVTGTAGERTHTWEAVVTMHVRDGRIAEGWVAVRDQHALDDFLNGIAGG